jgi:nucleotide-binding universal stress UspA family protein
MAVRAAPIPRGPRVAAGYRRILVPVVDDAVSVEAVDVACRLAAERHGSITLTTVVEVPPQLPLDAHMDEEDEDARAVVARAQAVAEAYGVDVTSCVVHARDAAEAIVEQARRTGAELLVVAGTCGGRRIRGTIRDVLRKAPCRVALIAARDRPAGSRPPAR